MPEPLHSLSHSMTLLSFSLKTLCTLFLLSPWILTSAQNTLQTQSSGFTLEALCSDSRAAVRWTVDSIYVETINALSYSCTHTGADDTDMEWTHNNDACFALTGSHSIDLTISNMHLSMTHFVERELPVGTVCVFSASSEGTLRRSLGNEKANCTVKEPMLLPASCGVPRGEDKCECYCNDGFAGSTSTYSGTTCRAVNTTDTQTVDPSPEINSVTSTLSTLAVDPPSKISSVTSTPFKISSVTSTLSTLAFHPPSKISSMTSRLEVSVTPTSTSGIQKILLTDNHSTVQTDSFLTASTKSTVTGSLHSTPTPTMHNHNNANTSDNNIVIMSLFPIMALFILLGLTGIVIMIYRKKKFKRLHDKLAMPFGVLKFEKIDPDFNPIDINSKMTFLSESMPSVFNTFGSGSKSSELIEEDEPAIDSQSIMTEKNSLAISRESIGSSETEEQEIILAQQNSSGSAMDTTSSGYISNDSVPLYKQTTNSYIETVNFHQDPTDIPCYANKGHILIDASTAITSNTYGSSIPSESKLTVEANSSSCIATEDDRPAEITRENDEQCKNEWNAKSTVVSQPADYLMPTFSLPQVFFSFPKELAYDH